MNAALIVPAAGLGRRLGARTPKALVKLSGRPLLVATLKNLKAAYPFKEIVVAAPKTHLKACRSLLMAHGLKEVKVVSGGATRAESVLNAFQKISSRMEWVAIHDAARPLVLRSDVKKLFQAAQKTGGAILALPITATVKKVNNQAEILRTEDRSALVTAQTPQVFKRTLLSRRYRELGKKIARATDEAALFDRTRVKVKVVPGACRNIKITTPADLDLAEFYLKKGA